jgi:hypothetical protein
MKMSNREEKRLRHAADGLLSRGEDVVDSVKDRAVHLWDNLH